MVECAFRVFANKWRIFHTPLLVDPDFIDDIAVVYYTIVFVGEMELILRIHKLTLWRH